MFFRLMDFSWSWPFLSTCALMGIAVGVNSNISFVFVAPLLASSILLSLDGKRKISLTSSRVKETSSLIIEPKVISREMIAPSTLLSHKKIEHYKGYNPDSDRWNYYAMLLELYNGENRRITAPEMWHRIQKTYSEETPFYGEKNKIYFDENGVDEGRLVKINLKTGKKGKGVSFSSFCEIYSDFTKLFLS